MRECASTAAKVERKGVQKCGGVVEFAIDRRAGRRQRDPPLLLSFLLSPLAPFQNGSEGGERERGAKRDGWRAAERGAGEKDGKRERWKSGKRRGKEKEQRRGQREGGEREER